MLSSAKKSVPTIKQFKQPYFIEIAPDGAITAICARFTTLLQEKNIYSLLEKNIAVVFSQLGSTTPGITPASFKDSLPNIIDLSIDRPHANPFIIRWVTSPIYDQDVS